MGNLKLQNPPSRLKFSSFAHVRYLCYIAALSAVLILLYIQFVKFLPMSSIHNMMGEVSNFGVPQPVIDLQKGINGIGAESASESLVPTRTEKEPLVFDLIMAFFNDLGARSSPTYDDFEEEVDKLQKKTSSSKDSLSNYVMKMLDRMRRSHEKLAIRQLQKIASGTKFNRNIPEKLAVDINLTMVACGNGTVHTQALTMLKSATLFSQDANLHVIAFGARQDVLYLAEGLQQLRWDVNVAGWDFTYEMHQEWYPPEHGVEWKQMFRTCATQRLFFPSQLPHIDSTIYLDTDILVFSNLTKLWNHFRNNMKHTKMAAAAQNNEPTAVGWYSVPPEKIPYVKPRGINAGVMLMNLTQMRSFNLEARSVAIHAVYKEKIELADQDIYNIFFHTFRGKLHRLDCSYNFNWVHCGVPVLYECFNETTNTSKCFCKSVLKNNVEILHGNGHTFYSQLQPFMKFIYHRFIEFDLVTDSPLEFVTELRKNFTGTPQTCHPLTENLLFDNMNKYLEKIYS